MKKERALIALPSLSLLFLAVIASAQSQYVALVPCHFNSMCSCKMTQPSRLAESPDYSKEADARNRTLTELDELLADGIDRDDNGPDTDDDDIEHEDGPFDVSCVGVPFAFLPGKHTTGQAEQGRLEAALN